MQKNVQLRILTYVVIAYMLLAFAWWSILLFQKNQDAYIAKVDKIQMLSAANGEYSSVEEFRASPIFQELTQEYKRQEWMILGEAIVFVFSLVIGVWLINRSYNREVLAAEQKRNFLLSITHELKSPIASIKLVLETLLKRDLPKEKQTLLSKNALKDTERLHSLVNDLLLAAKLEVTYQPNPENLNVSLIVRETIEKLSVKYPRAEITIQLADEDVYVQADRLGINSIVINLIENAIKYSFAEPKVMVKLNPSNEKIQFTVADQGIGINDNDKKKVFDRFYRVGNEDTRQTKGTGLGLYIVHEIVKAHRGTIKIKDNVPKGSIFLVDLPKQPFA